jgi:glutamate-1-semialdehyde 2,1-aminomutase
MNWCRIVPEDCISVHTGAGRHPRTDLDLIDMGGVGDTMAGNALSVAAIRATLEQVLTDDAFARMTELAAVFTDGIRGVFAEFGAPWSISQLGARAECRFIPAPPRTGTESRSVDDIDLDDYLHTYLANRGMLLTPFHDMALICPQNTAKQVYRRVEIMWSAVAELAAS